jgi:putative DNA primase/helicase
MMNALARLESALDRYGCNPKTGSASCPANGHFPDQNPSLSYGPGQGRAVVTCHRGCHVDDVLRPLNMTTADLFDEPRGEARPDSAAHYPYTDAEGRLLFEVVRLPDKQFRQRRKDSSQPSGWTWKLDPEIERPLYRLPAVIEAVTAGERIFLCEGEKDVHTLEVFGLTATTKAGGAGGIRWAKVPLHPLDGARVIVLPDHDADGTKYALGFLEAIGDRANVRVIHLPLRPTHSQPTCVSPDR